MLQYSRRNTMYKHNKINKLQAECDQLIGSFSFSCSYDFTPLDSSAVYVLSSMARQRRTSLSSGGAVSPDCDKLERSSSPQSSTSKSNRSHTSGTASGATPTKCKRPMNAFMLFAKKYRVEYTQMYPGKDNRYAKVNEIHYKFHIFCRVQLI